LEPISTEFVGLAWLLTELLSTAAGMHVVWRASMSRLVNRLHPVIPPVRTTARNRSACARTERSLAPSRVITTYSPRVNGSIF
jgi:hypothetical protein